MVGYVAGNGISRNGIDLRAVKNKGKLYGCNALYKDIAPDVLVATDKPMSDEIQNSGYALHHTFYTRNPFSDKGAKRLREPFWGWSSGPNAVQLAVAAGHKEIFLFGFDFGSTTNIFNNCYADTTHYKKSTDPATFGGNWLTQTETIFRHNRLVEFNLVISDTTNCVKSLTALKNVDTMNLDEFSKHINNVKDE